MNDYLQPLNSNLLIVEKLFPPEKEATKFDKVIDLIKAASSGTPWGVLGQAIETTGKVCSAICSGNQRVQAVKYVKDAYEMKLRVEEEIARIHERAETRRTQERLLTLYVEKSFQAEMDKFSKKIILDSHNLDLQHEERMLEIQNLHELAIKKMDIVASQQLSYIDKHYAGIIRRNEMYCLLYRQYLKFLGDTKTTPSAMISVITQRYMDIFDRAISKPNVNPEIFAMGIDGVMKLLQFLGDPDSFFVPFDKFIAQKKTIEELSV